MPDWVTHAIIGLIVAELFGVKKKSLVLLGTLLPDILPKLVLVRLFVEIPNLSYKTFDAFHTPFILFLATLLIAPLFRYDQRKVVFWLNLGAISHFLSDALLRSFLGGVRLLYPFSSQRYTLNLVWPNESYLIALPALAVYLIILIVKQYRKNETTTNTQQNI